MPVRSIPKNYRNVTGIASGLYKSIGKAAYESTLERDFYYLLEYNRQVKSFEVQPMQIPWIDDSGRQRTYTPDVFVCYQRDRFTSTIFEVKYRSDLQKNWKELRPKFKAAIRFAKERGWRFKIVTDKEIRTEFLKSITFLLPYINPHLKRRFQSSEDMYTLEEKMMELRRATPATLLEAAYKDEWNRALALPTLWFLIGIKVIKCDLNQPLNMSSKIWSTRRPWKHIPPST